MKLYLSGPMTFRADSDWNYPAFHVAAAELRLCGHEVFNPAESFGGKTNLPRNDYMSVDLAQIPHCEALAMLPGWKYSEGASLERTVALSLDKDVFDYLGGGVLSPTKAEPWELAYFTVRKIMAEGLKKHPAESWRDEHEDNHLDKAARHILTHKLIRDGHSPQDGETHLLNAACRLSMALAQRA